MTLVRHWLPVLSYLLGAVTLTLLWSQARAAGFSAAARRVLWTATIVFALSAALAVIGAVGSRL